MSEGREMTESERANAESDARLRARLTDKGFSEDAAEDEEDE